MMTCGPALTTAPGHTWTITAPLQDKAKAREAEEPEQGNTGSRCQSPERSPAA